MSNDTTLSTIIDFDIKEALVTFCKQNGLKLRYFIEQALVEKLEDEIDIRAYNKRKNEETFSLEEVLADSK